METIKKGLLLLCVAFGADLFAERSALRESSQDSENQVAVKKETKKHKKTDKKEKEVKKKSQKSQESKKIKPVKKHHQEKKNKKEEHKKDQEQAIRVGHRLDGDQEKREAERGYVPSKKVAADKRKAERKADRIARGEESEVHYICKEEYGRKLYTDFDYGFLKTSLFKTKFLNSSGIQQTVTQFHSACLPMIRAGFGVDFVGLKSFGSRTTHGRVGLQVAFAQRGDALDTIWTGTSTGIIGKQGVKRGELMLMGSYDLWCDTLSLEGGIGVVGGALKEFGLYQTNGEQTPLYTGQYLKPHSANLGGFFGIAVAHRFKDMERLRFEFGYRAVFSSVKYYRTVYQDAPSSLLPLGSVWQNTYLNVQANGQSVLPAEPHFRICAQQLALSVIVDL